MHAMEEKGGVLSVSLKPTVIDATVETLSGPISQGQYVTLTVTDTGTGIDSESLPRLIDLFYATKEVGKGTGLGLAMVHEIAKGLGARLLIESELGLGTTVQVQFPMLEDGEAIEVPDERTQLYVGEKGHVMVVDDESTITRVTTVILRRRGFTVVSFNNATEAFEVDAKSFDSAVLDYMMPGKTGLELAKALYQLNPAMPVVMATGLIEDAALDLSQTPKITEIIKKPFRADELVEAINRAL